MSIALFPCSYIDGARLLGELQAGLGVRAYTDELLLEEVASAYDAPVDDLKRWLYGATPPGNRLTLEKNKYINLFKKHLLEKLTGPNRFLVYGYLAVLVGDDLNTVLKILVVDSLEGRIRRAMIQEGCSRCRAEELIGRHDRRVSRWTRFLFGRDAYDYSLYDTVISCRGRDLLTVTEEIVGCCRQRRTDLGDAREQQRVRDLELAMAVERVLLESGYLVEVSCHSGLVELHLEISDYHLSWISGQLAELAHSVHGVREVRVTRSPGRILA